MYMSKGLKDFLISILKYFIIIGFFFYIADLTLKNAVDRLSHDIATKLERLDLYKLQTEIIKAAEDGGISKEDQQKIGESLAIIYSRDIEPILSYMNNSE